MGRLTNLKPRLAALRTERVKVLGSGLGHDGQPSWRAGKDSAASRGYGHRWRTARAGFLAQNPLCAGCERLGRVTEAKVVDHIEPHRGDQEKFWDRSNWQSLCASCHSGEKQREERAEP